MTGASWSERRIHLIFVVSILLKALNGVAEIILGVALLFTSTPAGLVETLVQGELIEDPANLVANYTQHFLYPLLMHRQTFISVYMLSHGVIKLFLAAGLLRNKLWAYPAAIVVFVLFIVYQIYRFTFTHSFFLIVLTVFDLIVIWLTWHEYKLLEHRRQFS